LKKKLLSPTELKQFRLQQEEQTKFCADQSQKNNKRLVGPKELLDIKPVVEVVEDPIVEEVDREPIELLQERVEEFVTQYSEELVKLENRLATKVDQDDINDELPEIKYYDDDLEKLTEKVDELQQSNIEVLSEFSGTLDSYRVNIERVNYLSESVEDIKTEIQTLLKKEDLDRVMMSQLLTVEQSICDLQDKIKTINENKITEIRLDISGLTQSVNEFLEVEFPQYKELIVDSQLQTGNRFAEIEENVNQKLGDIEESVDNKYHELKETLQEINDNSLSEFLEDFKLLDANFEKLKEEEIPRYKGFVAEAERNTESKLQEFNETFDKTVDSLLKKVSAVEGDKTNLIKVVNDKIQEVVSLRDLVVDDLERSETTRNDLNKKIYDLELNIIKNESHLKVQNKNLEQIQEDVRSTIKELNIEKLEKKNYELGKKIKYLEEVFEKFSEKEILTENIVAEPPSTDNKDPLTPLDQNFVTLDQLQQHYRLFINRIQQQLATIGGGGETRLEFLDDIDRDTAKVNGKYLKYDSSAGKWVGADAGAGSQTLNDTLGIGNTSSLGMSVGVATATKLHVDTVGAGFTYSEDLVVQGDARVTGTLSIGTSSIVLDSNTKTLSGIQQIRLDSPESNIQPVVIKQLVEKIVFVKTEINDDGDEIITEEEASVGIGSTASINTTGIITASSFYGDGSGLTGIVATGSGVVVQNDGSDVGTASTINFGSDLDATFSGGVATINVSIPLSALTDVNTSNLSGITTDYLMVYDPSVPGFKFVDPKTYFGINNDANPDPTIDDFGTY